MIIYLKKKMVFVFLLRQACLCCAVLDLLACLIFRVVKKKKDFFSFSEKNVGGIISRLLS